MSLKLKVQYGIPAGKLLSNCYETYSLGSGSPRWVNQLILQNQSMKKLFQIAVLAVLCSCSTTKKVATTDLKDDQTFVLAEVATDSTYGFSEKNPIEVGGANKQEGPVNERRFLNALAGPDGEHISYYRAGSCCPVKSKNGIMGMAMLDHYRVTWQGAEDTVSIYINMYDYGDLKAPAGFTIKK